MGPLSQVSDMQGVFLKSLTVPDFVTFPLKHEQINTCQVEIYVKEDFFV